MSNYTTEVRYICEFYGGYTESQGYDKVDEVIENSHEQVMGNYPIFDEAYRLVLNKKILKHYYTREICEETAALWRLRLNNRMNEIMPYYNKLYSSELLKFNPFYDVDLRTSHSRNEDTNANNNSKINDVRNEVKSKESNTEQNGQSISQSDSNSNSENSSSSNSTDTAINVGDDKNYDRYSDTPQGLLTGVDSGTYLTNARVIENKNQNNQISSNESGSSGSSNSSENSQSSNITNDNSKGTLDEINNINNNTEKNEENNVYTTEEYLEQVQGKRGGTSFTKLLMEYRESFLNIDRMIIDELKDLFFGLWA